MTQVDKSFRPALSVVATPNKRRAILDLAVEAENRGFSGLACPSLGGTMGLCVSLAHVTSRINYWTSIQPIYYSHPVEAANTVAHINEMSNGRFRYGIGVSHGPVTQRLGVETGKPLSDIKKSQRAQFGQTHPSATWQHNSEKYRQQSGMISSSPT
jgi:alkanesulfonate monooxygenase SsuD/methylene tetrahydromethanopterin reductase-like flavin-dependent oxidoreductase (luciferase family)